MKKLIKSEFETIDMAEKAAIAINKKLPFIKKYTYIRLIQKVLTLQSIMKNVSHFYQQLLLQ